MQPSSTNQQWLIKSNLEFRRETVPLDVVPSKDYLVRVDVCGLCRTDLHFATSWASNWEHLGHEFGGTIVSARRGDSRFRVGDRVAVKNASACLVCANCLQGRYRLCTGLIANRDGFSEYSDCDERSLVLAEKLDDDMLSLVEPTNVVLDLLHSAELKPNERVLVLGTGTLGFLTAHLGNRHFGVESIAVAARRPQSDPTIDFGDAAYLSFKQVGRNQADCVLVTTPPETLSVALEATAPGGRILTLGLANEDALSAVIDVRTLIFKRATVKGVFSVPNLYFEEAVDLLRRNGDSLRQIIRRRIPAGQLDNWFREWNRRNSFDGKTIVSFKDEPCLLSH
jgi:threonine dehydrogenase-like Zn-dependent dehydrogenase